MTVLASELRHTARLRHEVAQREKALYGALLDEDRKSTRLNSSH